MSKKSQRSDSRSSNKTNQSPVEVLVAKYGLIGAIIAALLGLAGVGITAYFGYLGIQTQIEKPIQATQTAVAEAVTRATLAPSSPVIASPVPSATSNKFRNPSCIYPIPRDQILPTPVTSKLNPFVTISGYVQYADGPAIVNAQVETDKGDIQTTDSRGYFETRVHSRPGVRLNVTISQDKFTFIVDAYSDLRVILCISR